MTTAPSASFALNAIECTPGCTTHEIVEYARREGYDREAIVGALAGLQKRELVCNDGGVWRPYDR